MTVSPGEAASIASWTVRNDALAAAPGGKRRLDGMICFVWLGLCHESVMTEPPSFSKYSSRMSYLTPAVRAIGVPLSFLPAWLVQLLMTWTPLTQRRTPSSERVLKV